MMTSIEKLIYGAIALLLLGMAVGLIEIGADFKRVCAESGGTTVWDGRQYQCIKVSKADRGE